MLILKLNCQSYVIWMQNWCLYVNYQIVKFGVHYPIHINWKFQQQQSYSYTKYRRETFGSHASIQKRYSSLAKDWKTFNEIQVCFQLQFTISLRWNLIWSGLKMFISVIALQALPTDNQLTHTSVSSTTSDDIQLIASNDSRDANHSVAVNTRTSKVSRCFGNTLCMPQNLLCFKVRLSTNFSFVIYFFCFNLISLISKSKIFSPRSFHNSFVIAAKFPIP